MGDNNYYKKLKDENCLNKGDYFYTLLTDLEATLTDYYYKESSHLDSFFDELVDAINEIDDQDMDFLKTYLFETKKTMISLLRTKPGNIKKSNESYQRLKNFLNNMDIFNFNLEESRDNVDAMKCGDKLIQHILFKDKDIEQSKMIIDKLSYVLASRDKNGYSILSEAVKRFTKELDKYLNKKYLANPRDIIYYADLIELLRNNEHFKYKNKEKYHIDKILDKYLSKYKVLYGFDINKEKAFYWIDKVKKILDEESNELTKEELLYENNINFDFTVSQEKLAKNSNIPLIKRSDGYANLHDRILITIDSEGAMDLDDALSVSRMDDFYKLGVHIADPYAYLEWGHPLIEEAINRANNIYLGDKERIPMFPSEFSRDVLSLNQEGIKYFNSYYLIVMPNGEISFFNIKRERGRINAAFTYEEFNELSKEDDSKLYEVKKLLMEVTDKLKAHDNTDKAYLKLKNNSLDITGNRIVNAGKAQNVLEQSLLAANHKAAMQFDNFEYPFIYRNFSLNLDDKDRNYIINELAKTEPECADMLKKFNLNHPYYDTVNKGHEGIKVKAYSHITSPIRRAADLVNTYCIERYYLDNNSLKEKDIKEVKAILKEICEHINSKEELIEEFYGKFKTIPDDSDIIESSGFVKKRRYLGNSFNNYYNNY